MAQTQVCGSHGKASEICWSLLTNTFIAMIYLKSLLNCIDNSGAQIVECVKVLKKSPKNFASVGDRIVVVVKKARPLPANLTGQAAAQKVQKSDIHHAVVCRTKQHFQRPDGTIVKFDDNACVLIDKNGEPIGTRVSSLIASELRAKGFNKIVSLAPRTI